jgi:hypothetical protein
MILAELAKAIRPNNDNEPARLLPGLLIFRPQHDTFSFDG